MIIDTHTHFYDPSRPQGVPWPPADNTLLHRTVLPHHCIALAAPHGVTGTIVVEASEWLQDNQWILDLAAANPFIVGFVGHIVPDRDEFSDELERFSRNPLLRGVRARGPYFEDVEIGGFLRDMATLAEKDLELDVIIDMETVGGLVKLANHLPELRIVINHIAHMPIDGRAVDRSWIETYQHAADHPRVYMKVSALMEQSTVRPAPAEVDFYRPALDAMWDAFGEDRLIYGSNWPVSERTGDYAAGINIVKAYFADKGEAATEKYFWRNAKAAYGWGEHTES